MGRASISPKHLNPSIPQILQTPHPAWLQRAAPRVQPLAPTGGLCDHHRLHGLLPGPGHKPCGPTVWAPPS